MNTANPKILQDIDEKDAKTQTELGKQYYSGIGRPRNYCLAERCFRKAANEGNAEAQYWLGKMYEERKVSNQDENWCRQEAEKWYRKAAEQNCADAQLDLGKIYLEGGGGVEEDVEDAYKWFALAAAQGSEEAKKKLDELENEKKMTPEKLTQAQSLAVQEWYSMSKNGTK